MASPSVGDLSPESSCTIAAWPLPRSPIPALRFRILNTPKKRMSMRQPLVSSRSTVFFRLLVPATVLAAYAVAWGWTALGRGVPGGDDHPGQLYRLIHAITLGPAPWHWNAGWWAGYPELQYYPPGFFYLGYALHWLALGLSSPGKIYLILVWLAFLLPGAATY